MRRNGTVLTVMCRQGLSRQSKPGLLYTAGTEFLSLLAIRSKNIPFQKRLKDAYRRRLYGFHATQRTHENPGN